MNSAVRGVEQEHEREMNEGGTVNPNPNSTPLHHLTIRALMINVIFRFELEENEVLNPVDQIRTATERDDDTDIIRGLLCGVMRRVSFMVRVGLGLWS